MTNQVTMSWPEDRHKATPMTVWQAELNLGLIESCFSKDEEITEEKILERLSPSEYGMYRESIGFLNGYRQGEKEPKS